MECVKILIPQEVVNKIQYLQMKVTGRERILKQILTDSVIEKELGSNQVVALIEKYQNDYDELLHQWQMAQNDMFLTYGKEYMDSYQTWNLDFFTLELSIVLKKVSE